MTRTLRIPRLLRLVHGVESAAQAFDELALPPESLLLAVHTGDRSRSGYGKRLAAVLARRGTHIAECVVDSNNTTAVSEVARRIAAERPAIVLGVGGGRVVDVAKLAAAQHDTDFISVPTQASSDGICSPVAVIVSDEGRPSSIGARIPTGIVVDLEVLRSAPLATWRSGLGDLISNLSAVRDWRDAHAQHGESIDDFACLTSEAAALSVASETANLADPTYQEKLIRGLILSGVAMEMAGSSRPASGSEHLISHALDALLERPHLHGLQVALATIATAILRGDDVRWLIDFYGRVGLPIVPADLEIPMATFLEAVRRGPTTRVDRVTLLDDLGEADLGRLEAAFRELPAARQPIAATLP